MPPVLVAAMPPISVREPASLSLPVPPFVTRDAAMRDAAPVARADALLAPQQPPARPQPSISCATSNLASEKGSNAVRA